MTRTSTFVALFTGASLCLGACGSEAPTVVAQTGMLSAPFAGSSAQQVGYRLRNAVFAIEGPSPTSISSEDYLEQAEATVPLAAGAYTIALAPGWTMERSEQAAFVPVAATLASGAVQSFTIVENQRSTVAYKFQAGAEMIDVGKPGLGLAIEVEDPPRKPVPAPGVEMPDFGAPAGDKPALNQIALLGSKVCGIRADRTVLCSDGLRPFGEVQFEKIVGESLTDMLCGLGYPDHDIRCVRDFESLEKPTKYYSPPAGAFTSLAVGRIVGCATPVHGPIACWGNLSFASAAGAAGASYTSVALSETSIKICGVTEDHSVDCGETDWWYGSVPRPDRAMTSVSIMAFHACGLGTDGTAMCWGLNTDGQLLAPGGKFLQLAAGGRHTCGLRPDQSLVCWGYDVDGTASAPSGNDFVEVEAGDDATCALRTNGTVVCWGPKVPKPAADNLAFIVPPLVSASQVGAWTALVPIWLNNDEYQDLLYYDAATGRAVYTAGTETPGQETVAYETTYATGWTDVSPAWHTPASTLTDLTFYDAVTGNYSATIATGVPGEQTELYAGTGTAGCSSVVPMTMDADVLTDSLCYNATTGAAVFKASMGAHAEVTYAPGWTSIIPVRLNGDAQTDLLFYNRTTGAITLTIADGPAVQRYLTNFYVGGGFTTVVPLYINGDNLTDWMRYDESTGVAIYTLNLGNGKVKDIRTVQGPKGLKILAPIATPRSFTTSFIATYGAQ